jgi:hypothetical protein
MSLYSRAAGWQPLPVISSLSGPLFARTASNSPQTVVGAPGVGLKSRGYARMTISILKLGYPQIGNFYRLYIGALLRLASCSFQ